MSTPTGWKVRKKDWPKDQWHFMATKPDWAEIAIPLVCESELKDVLTFIAETGRLLRDPMYADPMNREGLATDCDMVAGEQIKLDYLTVKWQMDRAIKAEAELKELQDKVKNA